MGTGFCCVVAPAGAERALDAAARATMPVPRPIGEVTDEAGVVRLPTVGPGGRPEDGFRQASARA